MLPALHLSVARLGLGQRLMRWLRRSWQARCARAESPTRRVPYY
jgi:hypothetical protein